MNRTASMLQERFKQEASSSKMAQLVQKSSDGTLSSFEGIFTSCELSDVEKTKLYALLEKYGSNSSLHTNDYTQLCNLTIEVKAITKQAILLHGERIKRAQQLLKSYREGAFSAWLTQVYGNRQTPYNLLLYYELFHALPSKMRVKLEDLPRQAAYTLASRKGALQDKISVIENYHGQTKDEVLELIRKRFPLAPQDARRGIHPILGQIKMLLRSLNMVTRTSMSEEELQQAEKLLKTCQKLLPLSVRPPKR